ncbi:MAG: DUF975 family protein [Eubacterium sp.]|jgi:uncharacterized membrane protein
MHKKISEIKAVSRENLLGSYGTLIGAYILVSLIVMICSSPFTPMLRRAFTDGSVFSGIIGFVGLIVVAVIGSLFSCGILYMHLKIARRQPLAFPDLFFPFRRRPDKFIGVSVLMILISFACLLPGIICSMAGAALSSFSLSVIGAVLSVIGSIVLIILMLALALTNYLLIDSIDTIHVLHAFRDSRKLMRHNKARLFGLCLSYIGWMLLSLLSFGLATLWVSQYYQQSLVIFYEDLTSPVCEAEPYDGQ